MCVHVFVSNVAGDEKAGASAALALRRGNIPEVETWFLVESSFDLFICNLTGDDFGSRRLCARSNLLLVLRIFSPGVEIARVGVDLTSCCPRRSSRRYSVGNNSSWHCQICEVVRGFCPVPQAMAFVTSLLVVRRSQAVPAESRPGLANRRRPYLVNHVPHGKVHVNRSLRMRMNAEGEDLPTFRMKNEASHNAWVEGYKSYLATK
jgi:hypothetical protein